MGAPIKFHLQKTKTVNSLQLKDKHIYHIEF